MRLNKYLVIIFLTSILVETKNYSEALTKKMLQVALQKENKQWIWKNRSQATELYLLNKNITKIPSKIFDKGFKNLKKLDLRGNQITKIDENAFEDLKELETLILSFNQVNTISQGELKGLKNLKYLLLDNNNIKTIKDGTFKNCERLIELHLQYNEIPEITKKTLIGLKNLEKLILSDNPIDTLEAKAFKTLKNLKYLYLDNTPYAEKEDERNAIKKIIQKVTIFPTL